MKKLLAILLSVLLVAAMPMMALAESTEDDGTGTQTETGTDTEGSDSEGSDSEGSDSEGSDSGDGSGEDDPTFVEYTDGGDGYFYEVYSDGSTVKTEYTTDAYYITEDGTLEQLSDAGDTDDTTDDTTEDTTEDTTDDTTDDEEEDEDEDEDEDDEDLADTGDASIPAGILGTMMTLSLAGIAVVKRAMVL